MPSLRTQVPIPSNVTHVVWQPYTGYQQYTVKCGCTTSMGTACRRWAIGYRDGVTPVCQAHLSPNATPTLSPAAIERRRVTAANQRAIRHTATVNQRIAGVVATINFMRRTITPDMTDQQSRSVYNRIGVLLQHIESIRVVSGAQVFAPTVPSYTPTPIPIADEPLAEEKQMVEDECPICMEDYVVIRKAPCGHHACPDCCLQMHAAGRTLKCPLCRDAGFRRLVSYAVPTPAPVTV
jgi:hypothetical protein